jgi:hypothetical protein
MSRFETQGPCEIECGEHMATATWETEFCGQRLSAAPATNEPQRRWKGLGRPANATASRGNAVLFRGLGNHVDLHGLLGGGRSPRKLVSGNEISCLQSK